LISLTFNAKAPDGEIFKDVFVYDSLKVISRGRASKTIKPATGSVASIYLLTLQKFLSTFLFYNEPNNDTLMNDENFILQHAKFVACPRQMNGYDCSLFGLGTLLHAINNIPIDETIFQQQHISLFRKELRNILSIDVKSKAN
jgi:hypothetical protein